MKRKPRKNFSSKGDIDMMKPIPLEKIGTIDDPCFSQFYDPNAEECNRCGDCELCAIAQAQKLHIKRAEIEKGQDFKDIVPLKVTWKMVFITMKKVLSKASSMSLAFPQLKDKVVKKLNIHESDFDKQFKILKTKNVYLKRFKTNNEFIRLMPKK